MIKEPQKTKIKKIELQTLSLFVLLGLLTLFFVLGVRWMLFAPEMARNLEDRTQIKAEK